MCQEREVARCSHCEKSLTLRWGELVCTRCSRPDMSMDLVAMELNLSRSGLYRLRVLLGIEAREVGKFAILSYEQQRAIETRMILGADWFVGSDGRVKVKVGFLARLTGLTRRRLDQLGERLLVRSIVLDGRRHLDLDSLIGYLSVLRDIPGRATRYTPKVTPLGPGYEVKATGGGDSAGKS